MMMQEAVENRELISALADGQLRGNELARAVEWVGHAEDARVTWHAYHLVGDVLRSGETLAPTRDAEFVQRLKLRLQQEAARTPELNAPGLIASCLVPTRAGGIKPSEDQAANDASFRGKLLAGVASLAVVSVIGWQAASGWGGRTGASELAQAPVQAPVQTPVQTTQPEVAFQQLVVGGEPQVMIRDRQLDALLAAHRQFGGTSALQGPTGFIRNATSEGAAR